jgi:hypothetical protein
MPRACTICRHPQHEEIAVSLFRDGTRATARRFQVWRPALDRHKGHLPRTIFHAQQAKAVSEATSLFSRVEHLLRESETIATAAKLEKNWAAATSALREAGSCLELLGKLRGELQTSANVRIGVAVNVQAAPRNESELELAIALRVAEITNGFDTQIIARLKAIAGTGGVPTPPA